MSAPVQRPASNSTARKRTERITTIEELLTIHRRIKCNIGEDAPCACSCGAALARCRPTEHVHHIARAIRAHIAAGGAL